MIGGDFYQIIPMEKQGMVKLGGKIGLEIPPRSGKWLSWMVKSFWKHPREVGNGQVGW